MREERSPCAIPGPDWGWPVNHRSPVDANLCNPTIAVVMNPELARKYPAQVPLILNALKDAQFTDAIAELPESRGRKRCAH
jgi:hypothetical protein